jgi:hypothetical protein
LALGAAAGGGQNQMLVGPKKTKTRCEKLSRRVKKKILSAEFTAAGISAVAVVGGVSWTCLQFRVIWKSLKGVAIVHK